MVVFMGSAVVINALVWTAGVGLCLVFGERMLFAPRAQSFELDLGLSSIFS